MMELVYLVHNENEDDDELLLLLLSDDSAVREPRMIPDNKRVRILVCVLV